MELAAFFKPPPFVVKELRPETLSSCHKTLRSTSLKIFTRFLAATKVVGEHTARHIDCEARKQARAKLELVRGKEITVRFENVGGYN